MAGCSQRVVSRVVDDRPDVKAILVRQHAAPGTILQRTSRSSMDLPVWKWLTHELPGKVCVVVRGLSCQGPIDVLDSSRAVPSISGIRPCTALGGGSAAASGGTAAISETTKKKTAAGGCRTLSNCSAGLRDVSLDHRLALHFRWSSRCYWC